MKLLLALAFVLVGLHLGWSYCPAPARAAFLARVKRHALPITAIVLALLALLVAAFYFRSFSLL